MNMEFINLLLLVFLVYVHELIIIRYYLKIR